MYISKSGSFNKNNHECHCGACNALQFTTMVLKLGNPGYSPKGKQALEHLWYILVIVRISEKLGETFFVIFALVGLYMTTEP